MTASPRLASLVVLVGLLLPLPAAAQEGDPAVLTAPQSVSAWPSGDALRRDLQDIGFAFRIDRANGDWRGWAPRAAPDEAPALSLGGSGSADARATFSFDLLQTDTLGADVDGTLTALMEVASRLPLEEDTVERSRRFVVEELLVAPPELLEPCYVSEAPDGVVLAITDIEAGIATVHIASMVDRVALPDEIKVADCALMAPPSDGPEPGTPTSERVTISTDAAGEGAFDPADVTLEGSLVTVILTFRNDSAAAQSLTFEAPLAADTGLVEPGGVKLIVIRELVPGDYPFFSEGSPASMRGVMRIVERPTE